MLCLSVADAFKVKPSLSNDFIHYGSYCASYPEAPCQAPPNETVVQGFANAHDTDTEMSLFRSDLHKELVMAFPGTSSLQDFLFDFSILLVPYTSAGINCSSCSVHAVVLNAWNSIQPDSQKALDAAIAAYPEYKLVVAGRSWGAAITAFAYKSLEERRLR